MPRRKSLRDVFNQINRITEGQGTPNPTNIRRVRQATVLANRYRENIRNAIMRNNLGKVSDNLDTKFDANTYTRATAIGTDR